MKSTVAWLQYIHLTWRGVNMLWSIGSSPQVLKHCIFSHLPTSEEQTPKQKKKNLSILLIIEQLKGYKHNPFYVKSVRSESETSSHWKIVVRVMPGVEEGWVSSVTVSFVLVRDGHGDSLLVWSKARGKEGGNYTKQLHWHRCWCPQRGSTGGGSPLFSMLSSATADSQFASLLSHVTQPSEKEQEIGV